MQHTNVESFNLDHTKAARDLLAHRNEWSQVMA